MDDADSSLAVGLVSARRHVVVQSQFLQAHGLGSQRVPTGCCRCSTRLPPGSDTTPASWPARTRSPTPPVRDPLRAFARDRISKMLKGRELAEFESRSVGPKLNETVSNLAAAGPL
jgi:hypothetical protein